MRLVFFFVAIELFLFASAASPLIGLAKWRQQRALRRQAKLDYQAARGTQHLMLLKQANDRLAKQKGRLDRNIQENSNAIARMERERDEKLRLRLEQYIIETQLTEIPGIGPKLAQNIQAIIYHGRLRDLTYAYRVPGIGANRQAVINQWIRVKESQIPSLMQGNFSGKVETAREYNSRIESLRGEKRKAEDQAGEIRQKLGRAADEIYKLSKVTEDDFYRALIGQDTDAGKLETYLRGLFAEWEPVPDWFKGIVSE